MTRIRESRNATRRPAPWLSATGSRDTSEPSGGHRLRVLITSAGRRVELLQCFRAAAADLGVEVEMLACDLRPGWSPACHAADASFAVPPADDSGYVEAILEICQSHGVAMVVPTIDPELLPLSVNYARFETIGTHVAISQPALVRIARDKLATAAFFAAKGIPSPRTAPLDVVRETPESWEWPLLVKPRHGSAGRAVSIVEKPADLPARQPDDPMVAQELLRGQEYTVNMFFDRTGVLRCAIPHERISIRAGEVEKGITRREPQLTDLARQMAEVLPGPRGALCFQAMMAPGNSVSAFEINARFGGGYPLADQAGAHFARWLLEERLNMSDSANDDWQEGVAMLRYDAAVFVNP